MLKRLVKQRKEEFKNQANIERKRKAENIYQKRKVSSQNWRVGISIFFQGWQWGYFLIWPVLVYTTDWNCHYLRYYQI